MNLPCHSCIIWWVPISWLSGRMGCSSCQCHTIYLRESMYNSKTEVWPEVEVGRWGGQRSLGYGNRDSLLWAGSRRRLLQGKEFALLIFNQVSPTQIYLYYIHCVMGLVLLSSKSFLHEKIQIMKVFLEHATMQFHKD